MTELLFGAAGFIFIGFLIGKLFKGLNPFLVILGGVMILAIAPVFLQMEQRDFATAFFVIGFILNFNRPVTKIRYWISDLFGTLNFRRARAGYVADIEQQKEQAEAELYRQKKEVEEELRRQKQQAEQDIERQRREAEEAIRREAENLKREQERAQSNSNKSQSNQNKSRQESGQDGYQDQRHLNPRVFSDACEILGLGQGKTLKEYNKAYKKLMSQCHADKLSGLSEELKKQEGEKAKMLNIAMETIKKKLK